MIPKPSFAAVFCAWVDGFADPKRVDRIRRAALRVSISVSTAYAWMHGDQVPPSTKIAAVAEKMQQSCGTLIALVDSDRRRLASKRQRGHGTTFARLASVATKKSTQPLHGGSRA